MPNLFQNLQVQMLKTWGPISKWDEIDKNWSRSISPEGLSILIAIPAWLQDSRYQSMQIERVHNLEPYLLPV